MFLCVCVCAYFTFLIRKVVGVAKPISNKLAKFHIPAMLECQNHQIIRHEAKLDKGSLSRIRGYVSDTIFRILFLCINNFPLVSLENQFSTGYPGLRGDANLINHADCRPGTGCLFIRNKLLHLLRSGVFHDDTTGASTINYRRRQSVRLVCGLV